MDYEMKQIKQYTVDEVDELINKHNKLAVTAHYLGGNRGRDWLMGRLVAHRHLEQPYYEIQNNESISGDCERIYLEWADEKTKNKENKVDKNRRLDSLHKVAEQLKNITRNEEELQCLIKTREGLEKKLILLQHEALLQHQSLD